MKVELEHVVAAPVETVFAVVSDIALRPKWVGIAQERTSIVDGPAAARATYRAVDKVPGRTIEYTQTIERFEPNELLEESWDGPMAGRSTIRFREDQDATAMTIEAEVASPLPKALAFLEPAARAWAMRMFRQDLERLNALVLD